MTYSATSSVVRVGISFEAVLTAINDADETFDLELDLKYSWEAKGFPAAYDAAGKPAAGTDQFEALVDSCWEPLLFIRNVVTTEDKASEKTICLDPSTGRMHRFRKIRLTCAEALELHRFPFDRQLLAINITTYRATDEVVFVPYEGRKSLIHSRASRWQIFNGRDPLLMIPSTDCHGLVATSGRAYHACYVVIEAQRDWQWYAAHFIAPHAVILLMNANITLINRNDVADRSSVTLTLLLTAVAFQFVLHDEVPKKAYWTILVRAARSCTQGVCRVIAWDWIMSAGLFVQLITCLLVFLNADDPHSPETSRAIFWELTDDSVREVERIFIYALMLPWVVGNAIMIVGAHMGTWTPDFDSLVNHDQNWIRALFITMDDTLSATSDRIPGTLVTYRTGSGGSKEYVFAGSVKATAPSASNVGGKAANPGNRKLIATAQQSGPTGTAATKMNTSETEAMLNA